MDSQTPIPPAPPSGLRVREIKTTTVQREIDGVLTDVVVPELDDQDREIEVSSIVVPQHVEAAGADAIEAHVLEHLTAPAAPALGEDSTRSEGGAS